MRKYDNFIIYSLEKDKQVKDFVPALQKRFNLERYENVVFKDIITNKLGSDIVRKKSYLIFSGKNKPEKIFKIWIDCIDNKRFVQFTLTDE